MEKGDLAIERFRQGYSCAQAVFSVLAEQRGVETDLALRVAAGFGGGIARSAGTCGCVTGAVMALGLDQRDVSVERNKTEREATYDAVRRFMREFEERHGSTRCLDLLGCNIGTPEGHEQAVRENRFALRCARFVRDAVEMCSR